MKDRSHDEAMAEFFAQDSDFAIQYLNSMLEDGDQGAFLTALRQMARTHGGASNITEEPQTLCQLRSKLGSRSEARKQER